MHPFLPQQKLFKAYDIRGDVRYFTDDFLLSLGQSFAQLFLATVSPPSVVVGYDVRHQSESIAKTMAYQLIQNGIKVIWLGQVTTPMMAFMANEHTGNGLIVTASHSERHINGIKWLVNHESPSSQDIANLFDSLAATPVYLPSATLLNAIASYPFTITPSLQAYQAAIFSALAHINQTRPVFQNNNKLVIDCLNGATSRFAKTIFTSLGYDCLVLNDTPDGNFPKGNPDPTEAGRLTELCQSVVHHQADIGLAFDGDGDRLMVVDSTGELVAPDHLLYLLANVAIAEKPVDADSAAPLLPAVIFDVKCSHHLPILIQNHGGLPLMEKTGSSLMRKSLQNKTQNAIFAGELSGHFLFNDGYFVLHDDAIYAAIRLLNWLHYQPQSLTEIIADLPSSISTADMYLPIDTPEMGQTFVSALIARAKNTFMPAANSLDEFANPILAESTYQTPFTEFLPKQKAISKKAKAKKLPFFAKSFSSKTSFTNQSMSPQTITTIDGLRVDFPHGFGILRKSNTGNFLTVRFAGNSLADLQKIQQIFVELCQSIDDKLAKQVAMIKPQHF